MRITVKAEVAQNTPITISLTMPLSYWIAARNQLNRSEGYEAGQVLHAITVGIEKVILAYVEETKTESL